MKCSVVTYRFATSTDLVKIIKCRLLLTAFKMHSVKCSAASGAITEGQDVLFESDNDAEDALM